jgi:hypothetical protein
MKLKKTLPLEKEIRREKKKNLAPVAPLNGGSKQNFRSLG